MSRKDYFGGDFKPINGMLPETNDQAKMLKAIEAARAKAAAPGESSDRVNPVTSELDFNIGARLKVL
jgi:hypothetical protein